VLEQVQLLALVWVLLLLLRQWESTETA